MRQTLLFITAFFLFSSFDSSNEKSQIQNLAQELVSAWNRHDAKALANFWAEEGDLHSPWIPETIEGRREIEKHFAEEQKDKTKNSSLTLTIKNIRFVNPETAFIDANFSITDMSIGGVKSDPFRDHAVFLLVKREGRWQILIARPY